MPTAIKAMEVTKVYKPSLSLGDVARLRLKKQPVMALQEVSADMTSGKVHALIGPNGAGKTTFLKVVSGLLRPTRGRITVFGLDTVEYTQRVKLSVGFGLTETRSFFLRLSGRENLMFFASLYGMSKKEALSRTEELLDWVGLGEKADKVVWTYSTGMQQRLSLARALIHQPDLLILDEVTRGLDLAMRKKILDLIRSLSTQHGKTIILASHDMAAVKYCADVVWVMDKGRMLGHGSFDQMKPVLDQCFDQQEGDV